MHPEARNGIEAARLFLRNPPKYINGVKGLYMLSLVDCEVGRVARSSYYFMRHIDDVLDGDRIGIADPLGYAMTIRYCVETATVDPRFPIVTLASDALRILNQKARAGDDPKKDFLDELDVMIFDFQRSKDRSVLTQRELDQYYHDTFFPVINVMLIGLNSKLRAGDISELAFSQGRVYSVRDLTDDWSKGIINIPKEVLQRASLSNIAPVMDIQNSSVIHEWFLEQLTLSQEEIDRFTKKLNGSDEWLTIKMCNGLIKPMRRFIDAFQKTQQKQS